VERELRNSKWFEAMASQSRRTSPTSVDPALASDSGTASQARNHRNHRRGGKGDPQQSQQTQTQQADKAAASSGADGAAANNK
jgi:hypothetical protein